MSQFRNPISRVPGNCLGYRPLEQLMARYRILYWHHIPSVVEARDKEIVHKEELSSRFQELIDRVAMRRKLSGTDAYLEGWRKGRAETREGGADEVAKAIAFELEAQFEEIAAKDFDQIVSD